MKGRPVCARSDANQAMFRLPNVAGCWFMIRPIKLGVEALNDIFLHKHHLFTRHQFTNHPGTSSSEHS